MCVMTVVHDKSQNSSLCPFSLYLNVLFFFKCTFTVVFNCPINYSNHKCLHHSLLYRIQTESHTNTLFKHTSASYVMMSCDIFLKLVMTMLLHSAQLVTVDYTITFCQPLKQSTYTCLSSDISLKFMLTILLHSAQPFKH